MGLSNICAYLMKVTPETRSVHSIWYLRFLFSLNLGIWKSQMVFQTKRYTNLMTN